MCTPILVKSACPFRIVCKASSLAGKKHCGYVCGCERSRKGEGHDRLRLQQTRQLKKKKQGCNMPEIKVRQLQHGFTKKAKVSPNLTVAHNGNLSSVF